MRLGVLFFRSETLVYGGTYGMTNNLLRWHMVYTNATMTVAIIWSDKERMYINWLYSVGERVLLLPSLSRTYTVSTKA